MNSVVRIPVDHPAFAGHFPSQPLLPGVSLLAEVLEAALRDPAFAAAIGSAPRLANAKFLTPVRPGDVLDLRLVAQGDRLAFEMRRADRVVATGQFEPARETP